MNGAVMVIVLLLIGLTPVIVLIYFQTRNVDDQTNKIKRKFNLRDIQDLGRVKYNHRVVGTIDIRLYKATSFNGEAVYITDTKKELRVAGQYRHQYKQITRQQALELSDPIV